MGFLDFLFRGKSDKIQDFKNRGAVILDVRTQKEWDAGHISGAKHIPLNQVSAKLDEIKKWDKPIIAHCAMGGRSGQAVTILKQNDIEAINGGGYKSLKKKL